MNSKPSNPIDRRRFVRVSLAAAVGGVLAPALGAGASASKQRSFPKRRFRIRQIADDGDNNAFFPSAAAGKLFGVGDGSTVMGYATQKGAALWRQEGGVWRRGTLLPIQRPYLVEDTEGFVHAFGLEDRGRGQEIWHYTAREPHAVSRFDEGERIYEKNYSAAVSGDDGTLYYFGAGLKTFGFREKPRGGTWSDTHTVAAGSCIYPAAVCRGQSIHLIFCGWNGSPALYEGIYYMRSDDRGASWRRSDGRALTLPADWKSPEIEILSGTQATGGGEANTHNLSLLVDRTDRPHILYWYSRPYGIAFGTASGSDPEPNIRVKHLRRDADGWKSSLLCLERDRDIAYAVLAEDERGGLHAIVTQKRSNDRFYDLGYTFSNDAGDTWAPIQVLTRDAHRQRLSYAHVAVNPRLRNGRLQFTCNMWSGKKPSPIWYGEVELA
ncbi:MAG: hypothetical protein EXS36_17155 [Pedosphaera sp.]|nr:hypothetical protein [Pedosphaera sp.]